MEACPSGTFRTETFPEACAHHTLPALCGALFCDTIRFILPIVFLPDRLLDGAAALNLPTGIHSMVHSAHALLGFGVCDDAGSLFFGASSIAAHGAFPEATCRGSDDGVRAAASAGHLARKRSGGLGSVRWNQWIGFLYDVPVRELL